MKLKDKKTGEIVELKLIQTNHKYMFDHEVDSIYGEPITLKSMSEEWEDYEEPKEYWYINSDGAIYATDYGKYPHIDLLRKEIGNYFEIREEAGEALEKIKAWKRMKDKGFKFTGFAHKDGGRMDELEIYCQLGEPPEDIEDMEDAGLIFGSKE